MKCWRLVGAIAALLLVPLASVQGQTPAAALSPPPRPPRIATAAFTERSGFEDLKMSPDGNNIALKATTKDGKVHMAVLDAATRTSLHNLVVPARNTLEWFSWAGNRRVLLSLSQLGKIFDTEVRYTRLFAYDLDTRTFNYIGTKGMGISGDDLVYSDPAGQFVLLAIQSDIYEYPSVWRFPLDGTAGKGAKRVQSAKNNVWSWFADTQGVVRMGFEVLDSGAIKVLYRPSEVADFKTIAKIDTDKEDDDVWDVVRIISGSDEGYVLKKNDSGQVVLRKFDYATRTPGETMFAAPDGWDLTEAQLGQDYRPVAAYYTDDRDRTVWFEPKMKALQARFERALKGSEVQIISRARDGSRMIVWAGSESDPGAIYIYTAKDSKLELLYALKPALDPAQLAVPKPVKFKARDGTELHGYLTLPPGRDPRALPLIVLPHGGPYGVRDKLDFDSEVQFLANRGYAVLQPNYRGSTGYGSTFAELGSGQIGRKMQDDLDDAMDWAVAQGYVDRGRVCVVGSSYGGYAALWAVTRNPERYRCAASFAGVTDWNQQLSYDRNYFSRAGNKKWRTRIRGEASGFNLDTVSPARQVSRLTRPVLLAHGEDDTNVPFKQFKLMRDGAAAAKVPIQVLTFADEGHGFDKAEDFTNWLDTLGAFLTKNNPAD